MANPDSSRALRPVLVDVDIPGVPVRVYSFRGATLYLHTLLPPVVLTWLTQNFGALEQQERWEDCLRRRPLPPLRKVTEPGPLLLDHFEVLRVCLLATPPFLEAPHHQVWALHGKPSLPLPCQDWWHLVTALAAALFTYLVSPHTRLLAGEWRAVRYQEALDCLKELALWNAILRRSRTKRLLLQGAEKGTPVSRGQFADAVQTITTSIEQFSSLEGSFEAMRAHTDLLQRAGRDLSVAMYRAFVAYGPLYHRRVWSKRAIAYTLATVLAQLDLEEGDLDSTARRIRQRLTRHL
jgi:hypothetical protein